MAKLLVQRLNGGKLPCYAHQGDAGLDLYAASDLTIPPQETVLVPTGIKMAIPEGHVGIIKDKSGLARESLHTLAGVVDSGYRGEILVVLKNFGDKVYNIRKNQKIAQMLVQPIARVEIVESKELPETIRGERGFGSTGLH
ncbi:dUTP diphosphatase [Candidatus Woesearchaeota archaeon]|nr:dUTP diphosphatase [Candidatus Woesearchaeota archaeon]